MIESKAIFSAKQNELSWNIGETKHQKIMTQSPLGGTFATSARNTYRDIDFPANLICSVDCVLPCTSNAARGRCWFDFVSSSSKLWSGVRYFVGNGYTMMDLVGVLVGGRISNWPIPSDREEVDGRVLPCFFLFLQEVISIWRMRANTLSCVRPMKPYSFFANI